MLGYFPYSKDTFVQGGMRKKYNGKGHKIVHKDMLKSRNAKFVTYREYIYKKPSLMIDGVKIVIWDDEYCNA